MEPSTLNNTQTFDNHPFALTNDWEAKYTQLMDSLPIAVYTTDVKGYITSYNRQAVNLWGQEPAVGKELWCNSYMIYRLDGSPIPPDRCPIAITLEENRAVDGEQMLIERADGTKFFVKAYSRPMHDGEGSLIGAVDMLIEITDMVKAELIIREKERHLHTTTTILEKKEEKERAAVQQKHKQLQKSEEQYHKMIEEVEDYAILLMDKDGFIQNWNKGAEKIKGYKEEEIVGKNFRLFYQKEDQDRKLPEMLIGEAENTGKANHEGWRVRKDGTRFWGSIVLTALHNDNNEIIGFSKVTRDLTARKAAEDKVIEYARKLEIQNKELQTFAYAAAHDMKEPLRKMQYFTSSILNNPLLQLPAKELSYLKKTADAACRMHGFINDLLAYTGVSGKQVKYEPVDLNIVLQEVLNNHQETIEQTGAAIEALYLPVINGVPLLMQQLLDNLLGNAFKYRRSDLAPKIRIWSEMSDEELILRDTALSAQKYYKINIEDNGIGFLPEYNEKIFDMFERLHTRDHYPGTGIGLALCRKIVEHHGGVIKAFGRPGLGASFVIYLPVKGDQ